MRKGIILLLIFAMIFSVYLLLHRENWEERAKLRKSAIAGYVLPSKYSRIMALEYDGLLSNFQFLKLVSFFGDRVIHGEGLTEKDWDFIVAGLESITDLDPYFLDPYLFGESLLTWEAGRIEDANRLLEKGMRFRKEDWQFPFYLGFNHFYFQKNFKGGAEFLRKASLLPESPNFLPTLAARLGYYGNEAKTAVIFLKSMLLQTTDPNLRTQLEARVLTMERAIFIEEKVAEFSTREGHRPEDLNALIQSGYLETLPEDPYGGEWRLLESGRVYTTSRFVKKAAADEKNPGDPN